MATIVEVPSTESDENECSLIFVAPPNKDWNTIHSTVEEAISGANDDNGERSEEVIAELREHGFEFLGNPEFVEQWPRIDRYIVTQPWI